ncbi:MAG TPA: ATP synthase F0 subunit B [Candidatus Acidoferrales bacterium]|nr:ATP synthase F0 subunit B [Candidatus Acidoferrales bacterium]
MLLSIDGTFLVQILNFILFYLLLNWLFIGPTRRAIEERRRYVANLYREGDELTAEAKAVQGDADRILAQARKRTEESMRVAATRASDETHAIERKATEEANAHVALAQATVASERAAALERQQQFVGELARSMVERATQAVG